MRELTSRTNRVVIDTIKLYDKKYRNEKRMFLAEGEKLLKEAIISEAKIEYVIFQKSKEDRFAGMIDGCEKKGIPLFCASDDVFSKLSKMEAPEGIITVCAIPQSSPFKPKPKRIFLHGISDPGNMGTIIRTADAFGMPEIILGDSCVDIYNPKTVRATMGSVFRIKFCTVNTVQAIEELKLNGISVYAAILDSGAKKLSGGLLSDGCVVIGNESSGLPRGLIDICTDKITIPMKGRAESLNASVAAGIIIWEISRMEE